MDYNLLADLVVILHVTFVLFVLFGGLATLKWRWMLWLHLPALAWGATVEFAGLICPLTPVENRLRRQTGGAEYGGDFVQHFLPSLLYPERLTRETQLVLGTIVVVLNLGIYVWVWRRSYARPLTGGR